MADNQSFKGYIFDFDGTLADSLPGIHAGWKATFTQLGLTPPSYDAVRRAIGPTRDEYLRLLLGEHAKQYQDEALRIFKEVYKKDTIFQTVLYDGVSGLIDNIAMSGARIAIASNKPYKQIVTLVEKLFGSNAPFNPVLGPECVKEGKPAPDMFLACAEAWRISPSEIVVVGDTPLDMDAGKRAGMKRIAVRWGYGDNNQLDACKPDYNVYKAAEIISLRP